MRQLTRTERKEERKHVSECVAASWLLHCQMPVCDALKMENVKQALNTNTNYSPPSPAPQKTKAITIHNVFYFPSVT